MEWSEDIELEREVREKLREGAFLYRDFGPERPDLVTPEDFSDLRDPRDVGDIEDCVALLKGYQWGLEEVRQAWHDYCQGLTDVERRTDGPIKEFFQYHRNVREVLRHLVDGENAARERLLENLVVEFPYGERKYKKLKLALHTQDGVFEDRIDMRYSPMPREKAKKGRMAVNVFSDLFHFDTLPLPVEEIANEAVACLRGVYAQLTGFDELDCIKGLQFMGDIVYARTIDGIMIEDYMSINRSL